jgi:hypothetical protein
MTTINGWNHQDAVETIRKQVAQERRERIATAALQGLLAFSGTVINKEYLATWSVEQADALIAELDRKLNEEQQK